jgi:hypothetical protein
MNSTTDQKPEKTTCDYCGKALFGREGKKYCNVDCKNNFNSRIRAELRSRENSFFPKAFAQIKKNYRILLNYTDILKKSEAIQLGKTELSALGFDAECCTGAFIDYRGKLWRCCNDYIWHEEGDLIWVKYQEPPYDRYR